MKAPSTPSIAFRLQSYELLVAEFLRKLYFFTKHVKNVKM